MRPSPTALPAHPGRPIVTVVLLLGCLVAACSRDTAPPPPDPALVRLYCDLALLAGDTGPPPPDSLRAAVFTRHGTTQVQFEASLQPYRDDPHRWALFFQAVLDTLQAQTGIRQLPAGFSRPGPPGGERPQPPGG